MAGDGAAARPWMSSAETGTGGGRFRAGGGTRERFRYSEIQAETLPGFNEAVTIRAHRPPDRKREQGRCGWKRMG